MASKKASEDQVALFGSRILKINELCVPLMRVLGNGSHFPTIAQALYISSQIDTSTLECDRSSSHLPRKKGAHFRDRCKSLASEEGGGIILVLEIQVEVDTL